MADDNIDRTACACRTCRSYCSHIPGWFLPDEIAGCAAALGITTRDLFRDYLTIDYWVPDQQAVDPIFVLRPRTIKEAGGAVAALNPFGVRCVFLWRGRCRIHTTKPHECATARHDRTPPKDWHLRTAHAWRSHQDVITSLLGAVPTLSTPAMEDVFGLLFAWLGRMKGVS